MIAGSSVEGTEDVISSEPGTERQLVRVLPHMGIVAKWTLCRQKAKEWLVGAETAAREEVSVWVFYSMVGALEFTIIYFVFLQS